MFKQKHRYSTTDVTAAFPKQIGWGEIAKINNNLSTRIKFLVSHPPT
jgi:hypothetical protein